MAQFSKNQVTKRAPSLVGASTPALTYEGGAGYTGDAKSQLFRLAVTSLWDDKYYESADDRRTRMVGLVKQIDDPEWMVQFVNFLRNKANIRSMSVAVAAEYAMAGRPNSRQVVNAAIARADEPAEMLGYIFAFHGRKIKSSIKRGIGDAVRRTWDEYTALKYDGKGRDVRMADVLNICHVKPRDAKQSALFAYLLNRRHGNKEVSAAQMAMLERLQARDAVMAMPSDERREALSPQLLKDAAMTWENLGGWVPGGMDSEAWEAAIPSMSYLALLRNLRNFREAKVSRTTMNHVLGKLADPDYVRKSRVLPLRFYTAYEALDGDYQRDLADALEASFANAPKFSGSTLIMVDTSGSMRGKPSEHAAVLASVFARQCDSYKVYQYATSFADMTDDIKGTNVLADAKRLQANNGRVGHGTSTWPNTEAAFRGGNYDRIVVLTDMQDHPARGYGFGYGSGAAFAGDKPVYVWDLSGYRTANIDTTVDGRYLFSGLNDQAIKFAWLYEQSKAPDWDRLFNG